MGDAEYGYVSLKDLLQHQPMPHQSVESTLLEPLDSNPAALKKKTKKKKKKKKKKNKGSVPDLQLIAGEINGLSGGKRSRSDEPLMYYDAVGGGEAFDDLEVLSKEMMKMWRQDIVLKYN